MISIKEIKKRTYREHVNLFGTYVGRPISYYIIKLLVPFGITGNQVSLFSILFFIIPLILISTGINKLAIIATSILIFIQILDHVDGGLARYYKNKTLMGKYLEFLYHELCIPVLFLGLGMYSFWNFNQNYYLIIIGALTMFATRITNVSVLGKHRIMLQNSIKTKKLPKQFKILSVTDRKSQNILRKIGFYFIYIFNDINNLALILLLLAIFNLLQYAILFYFVFYSLIALIKFFVELKKGFKEYGLE